MNVNFNNQQAFLGRLIFSDARIRDELGGYSKCDKLAVDTDSIEYYHSRKPKKYNYAPDMKSTPERIDSMNADERRYRTVIVTKNGDIFEVANNFNDVKDADERASKNNSFVDVEGVD